MNRKGKNLLKDKYPELLKELDSEKNKDINLNTLSFSSHKNISWICLNNTDHRYDRTVNQRTNLYGKNKISGCKICFYDSLRLQNKDTVSIYKNEYIQNRNTTKIGDETEAYVVELLNSMHLYKTVSNLGNIGANSDISITDYNNNTYYIQVKTLTYDHEDKYYMTNIDGYPDNMLIVMINKDRTRYALEFAGKIKVKRLALTFNFDQSKYKDIMFTDLNKFKSKLQELIIMSYTKLEFSSESTEKEFLMLKRFKNFCLNNNITYIRNHTNGEASDGTINGYKFQAKYVSMNSNTRSTYQVSSQKSAGTLNGISIKRHYEINDFDYCIIEIGGVQSDKFKYENNFCIIPIQALVDQNIMKSELCKGKKAFYICAPDSSKPHWSKIYWNVIPQELIQ